MHYLSCVAVDQDRFEWIINELDIEVVGTEMFGSGTFYQLCGTRSDLVLLAKLYYLPTTAKSVIEDISE